MAPSSSPRPMRLRAHRAAACRTAACSSCRCLRSANIPPPPRAGAGFDKVISAKGDAAALARSGAGKRPGQAIEEEERAALPRGRRSRARSRRRTCRARLQRRHPDDLPDGSALQPAARSLRRLRGQPGRGGPALFPAAARAPSSRRHAPAGSKSLRSRSRNAAFPPMSPRSSGRPGRRGSRWRHRRMKMPCLGRWSVLCGPDWRNRTGRIW